MAIANRIANKQVSYGVIVIESHYTTPHNTTQHTVTSEFNLTAVKTNPNTGNYFGFTQNCDDITV